MVYTTDKDNINLKPGATNMTKAERAHKLCQDIQALTYSLYTIRDELAEWRDNMPENMQGGNRYESIDNAANALEEYIDDIQAACGEIESMDWPR